VPSALSPGSTWPNSRGGSNEERLARLRRQFPAAGNQDIDGNAGALEILRHDGPIAPENASISRRIAGPRVMKAAEEGPGPAKRRRGSAKLTMPQLGQDAATAKAGSSLHPIPLNAVQQLYRVAVPLPWPCASGAATHRLCARLRAVLAGGHSRTTSVLLPTVPQTRMLRTSAPASARRRWSRHHSSRLCHANGSRKGCSQG
jgi:hypothetical protein